MPELKGQQHVPPLQTCRPADSRKTRVKGKRSKRDKKMFGSIPAQAKEES